MISLVGEEAERVPTKEQVRALLAEGLDHAAVGRRLGIAPGLVYLIATGMPADGGDAPSPEEGRDRGLRPASQELSNPPAVNPTAHESVHRWLRDRVRADDQMRGA